MEGFSDFFAGILFFKFLMYPHMYMSALTHKQLYRDLFQFIKSFRDIFHIHILRESMQFTFRN